jgi:hypothetical protein
MTRSPALESRGPNTSRGRTGETGPGFRYRGPGQRGHSDQPGKSGHVLETIVGGKASRRLALSPAESRPTAQIISDGPSRNPGEMSRGARSDPSFGVTHRIRNGSRYLPLTPVPAYNDDHAD